MSCESDVVLARPGPKLMAAFWILAGSMLFSLVFASGKLAGGMVPALQIVWIRYCSGFVTASGVALVRDGSLRSCLVGRKRWLHALRACCGIGGLGCGVYAAMLMPLADATALKLLQGVFIIMLAIPLLGERVRPGQALAALLCLAGAGIIIRSNGAQVGIALLTAGGAAPLIALLGALLIACEAILIKRLSRTETTLAMLFHANGFATLFLTIPILLFWQPVPPLQLGLLFLLGPMAIAGQICNIRAYRLADAAWLAPFGYSNVAFAALIGWVAFGDLPGPATLLGTVLIVAGGLLLLRR